MKKVIYLPIVAFTFALLLTACGAPTIDASSTDTIKSSMKEVTKDMSPEKKAEFMAAFTVVTTKITLTNMSDPEKAGEALKDALDGKTADDIIEMSRE